MFSRILQAIRQNAAALTPAGIASNLLQQMKAGTPPAQVARTLANFPGIRERIGTADVKDFWALLMNDPAAKAAIHPMDRGELKKYMAQVLAETRNMIGILE